MSLMLPVRYVYGTDGKDETNFHLSIAGNRFIETKSSKTWSQELKNENINIKIWDSLRWNYFFEKMNRWFRNTNFKVGVVSEFRVVKPKISSWNVLHSTKYEKKVYKKKVRDPEMVCNWFIL